MTSTVTTPNSFRYLLRLQSNIWKYGVFVLTDRRLFMAYLAIYFLSFPDHRVQQIGLYTAIGQIVGFFLELPSGYISDKLGHKQSLVLSRALLVLSSLAYVHGGSLLFFALGSALFSAGHAFRSGTAEAFMHETLSELHKEDRYSHIMGRINSITFIGVAALLFMVPFTVSINIRIPFLMTLVLDFIGLVTAMSFVIPEKTQRAIEEIQITNFKKVVAEARQRRFIPVAVVTAFMIAFLVGPAIYRDVYLQALRLPLVWIGIFFAGSRLVAGIIGWFIGSLKSVFSFRQYMLILGGIFTIILLLLGVLQKPWVIASLFTVAIGLAWGQQPLMKHYELDYIEDSNFKATLLSMHGLLYLLFFGGLTFLFGQVIGAIGFALSYVYYALIAGPIFLIVLLLIVPKSKHGVSN